uniref:Protein SPT2 homolog n=1 Tax=Geotrypetes seraphini TaxID=260995 RepID=A0A6P8PJ98_GEOSA|nr:protein SPT2 homolog isoform X2 [Geotrypetes seraphini]
MDYYNVLQVASQKQDKSNVTKRYSLVAGPPKKDPKVKGVQSAAVQAFLRRKEEEIKNKGLEEKRKKEQLLAKRKELNHDRKARAMASRTKDNFQGYNGIPIEEKPRKRRSRKEIEQELSQGTEEEYLTAEELYEYSQTDSDFQELDGYEEEEEPPKEVPKQRAEKKAPSQMNFEDLLKLAEVKQFEPVEIKVVKKTEERPMTAEELKEKEFLERKNKRSLYERERGKMENVKAVPLVMSSKQMSSQKDTQNITNSKSSVYKHSLTKGGLTGTEKTLKGPGSNEKYSHLNSSGSSNKKSDFSRVEKSDFSRVEKSGTSLKPSTSRASENGSVKLLHKGDHSKKKSAALSTKSEVVRIPPEIMASPSSVQPGRPLPPITSAYKRKIEDDEDEWDSEMDDFIDDGGENQDEISKHIREIFGYDKSRYKDESDYTLRCMETNWKEQQKEESRSLRLGIKEDLEEQKREEAELKAKRQAKKLKAQ